LQLKFLDNTAQQWQVHTIAQFIGNRFLLHHVGKASWILVAILILHLTA